MAYPRFLLLLPSVYSAHRHRNRVVPLVREESTSIASFARLTTSVDIPAIDTYVHAPFYCACACAYCSSILYSIHKSFCKSIHKSILYSIHKPFCKSILYSIYKSFSKSILAINKTIFWINDSVYLLIKIIILFLSHFAFHSSWPRREDNSRARSDKEHCGKPRSYKAKQLTAEGERTVTESHQ